MPEVRSDVVLDLTDALTSIDELGTAVDTTLADAATNFAAVFSDTIANLAPDIAALADAPVDVPVTADTAGAQDEIAALDSGPPVDVGVTADTSEAQSAIADLGSTAETAAGGVSSLGDSMSGLSGLAGVAVGEVGGLKSVIGETGAVSAGVVGGVVAVGAGIGELASKGIEGVAATQRFSTILGGFADKVSNVHVGSLNTTLDELSLKMGSLPSGTQQAAATVFQFARNAGIAGGAAAQFTSEVAALAARAVALNPSLGEISDVIPLMSRGLATGGRFAQRFGLDLTSAEIASRALTDTGKTTTAELSVTEKQMAGAAIAAEKYGGSLAKTVAEGSNNAAITARRFRVELETTLERLGAPLVTPFFSVIESALPSIEALGRVLGALGSSALPVVAAALQVVAPILDVVASALEALQPVITPLVAAFVAFRVVAFLPAVLGAVATGFAAVGEAGVGAALGVESVSVALEASPVGLVVAGLAAAAAAFGLFGGSAKSAGLDVAELGRKSDEALRKMAQNLVIERQSIAFQLYGQSIQGAKLPLQDLTDVAEKNIGTAERLGKAYVEAGLITKGQYKSAIDEASQGQRQLKADTEAGTAAVDAQAPAMKAATDSFNTFITNAVGKLPTLDSVLSTTQTHLQGFGLTLDSAASPEQFLADLQASTQGIVNFQANIQSTVASGFTNVAQFAASQGPTIGGAYLQAFQSASPAVKQATEDALAAQAAASTGFDAFLRGPFATTIQGGYQSALDKLPDLTSVGFAVAGGRMTSAGPSLGAAASGAGSAAATGFQSGVSTLPGHAGAAVAGAAPQIAGQGSNLGNPAFVAGALVGAAFGDGVAGGIASRASTVAGAARSLLTAAVKAARDAGLISSPSILFAREVGQPIGQGIALGIGSTAGLVTSAVSGLVSPSALAASVPVTISSTGAMTSAGASGGGGGPLVGTQNFYGMDPQAAARETGRELAFQRAYSGV